MLDTHTIVPDFRSSILGSTARVMRTGESKLTFIVSATSAIVSATCGRRLGIAALCTIASSPPKASHASSASFSAAARSERSTAHMRDSGVCFVQQREHFLRTVGAPGDDADGRTPLREDRRERGADTRRRAGEQDLRAFELHRSSFACGRLLASFRATRARPTSRSPSTSSTPLAAHGRRTRRRVPRARPCRRGRLRGQLGEVAGEAQVAGRRDSTHAVGEPARAARERRELGRQCRGGQRA